MSSDFDQFEHLAREQLTRTISQIPVPPQPWNDVRRTVERRRRRQRLKRSLVVVVLVGLLAPLGQRWIVLGGSPFTIGDIQDRTATPLTGTIQTAIPLTPIPPEVGYPYAPIVEQSATPDGFEPTPLPTVTPSAVPDSTATAVPNAAAVTPSAVPDSTATAAPDAAEVTPPASGESLLRKRNSPPPDMPGSILPAYGGLGCQALPGTGFRVISYEPEYEIGEWFPLCLVTADLEQPIELQIKDPKGTVAHYSMAVDRWGDAQFEWVPRPGHPLGVYQITATQGEQHFTTSVRIRAATQPRQLVMFSTNDKYLPKPIGRPGDTVWIVLAGFQPHQQVLLHLYKYVPEPMNGMWEYLAHIASVEMDADGQAVYELATRPDDPTGTYGILTQPPLHKYHDSIGHKDDFSLR